MHNIVLKYFTFSLLINSFFCCVLTKAEDALPDFNKDILPIFKNNCIDCHGADKQAGNFRLDGERFVRRRSSNGFEFLASSVDDSEIYQRLISNDPDFRMPRKGDPLEDDEIIIIKKWLESGSPWGDGDIINTSEASTVTKIGSKIIEKWEIFYPNSKTLIRIFILFISLLITFEIIKFFHTDWLI